MIRICEPDISDIEEDYVLEALRQNELSGHGKHVRQFEQKFADFLGAKHAIMVPNGTVSLHLVLAAFGVKAGDEVIIPSQTISSCAFACAYLGATVVVVDVDPNTFCMDVKALRKAITRKTKAIMPVHMFGGVPCEMDTIMNIARENGISVLEDAAEAIGSKYKDTYVGAIGDAGSFSLFANKNITTGEGGMITTNSELLDKKIRYLRNMAFGPDPETKFFALDLGYNYRPSNLAAALGCGQMDRIDYLLSRRQEIHRWYTKYLSDKFVWQHCPSDCVASWWMEPVLVKKNGKGCRGSFMTYTKENGIETRPLFPPLGSHHFLNNMKLVRSTGEKVSESLWESGVLMPSGGKHLTEEVVKNICIVANRFLE